MASYPTQNPVSFKAGANLSALQYTIVEEHTTPNQVVACTGAGNAIGVLMNAPLAGEGADVNVIGVGGATLIKCAAGLSAGDLFKCSASGLATPLTGGEEYALGYVYGFAGSTIENQVVTAVLTSPYLLDGMQNPMTAAGDLIIGGGFGAPTRLAKGSDGQVLIAGTDGTPEWSAVPGSLMVIKVTYDFDEDGGDVGTIDSGVTIPDGFIVWDGFIDCLTACTSADGNATIAVQMNAANDLLEAVDADTLNALQAIIPVGTAATAVKATDDREIKFEIGVEALTAGKLDVYLFGTQGVPAA